MSWGLYFAQSPSCCCSALFPVGHEVTKQPLSYTPTTILFCLVHCAKQELMEFSETLSQIDAVAKPDHAVLKLLKSICGRNLEEFVKMG